MEEEELLRFITMIASGCIITAIAFNTFASHANEMSDSKVNTVPQFTFKKEDIDFAGRLRNKSMKCTEDEVIEKYKELKTLEGKVSEGIEFEDMYKHKKSRPSLSLFVSSSMPIASLRAFSKEAKKYGANLVFKGLPNNSFQELIKLVNEINLNGEEGSMQLDDEAFARFSVTKVPTIVLVEEKSCKEFQNCINSYDKIEGNISIKLALEMFAKDGDTAELAQELLDQ